MGYDVSESMLAKAREKYPAIEFTNQMPGRSFDLITAFRFFVWADKGLRLQSLYNINAMLNKGGLFIFNVQANLCPAVVANKVILFLKRRLIAGKESYRQPALSIWQVKRLLRKTGFKLLRTHHRGVVPVKDEHCTYRLATVDKLEDAFSSLGLLRYAARYVIFVCVKEGVNFEDG